LLNFGTASKLTLDLKASGLLNTSISASIQKYESGVRKPGYKALRIICKRFPKYALALVIDDISTKQIYIKHDYCLLDEG
jgi:hypothetical protein